MVAELLLENLLGYSCRQPGRLRKRLFVPLPINPYEYLIESVGGQRPKRFNHKRLDKSYLRLEAQDIPPEFLKVHFIFMLHWTTYPFSASRR